MEHRTSRTTGLLALLVFLLFALCVLLVLLTGAGVYRGLVRRGEESFAQRTTVQYLATRVRQARTVTVQDFHGCKALVIPETIDGDTYLTRVYCHDGWLWELFSTDTADLSPEDGERVLEAEDLQFHLEGTLLTVYAGEQTLYLHLQGGDFP